MLFLAQEIKINSGAISTFMRNLFRNLFSFILKDKRKVMLALFLLALITRLISALFIVQTPITSDDLQYNIIAKNILDGKGFSYDSIHPTAARGPIYPFFLASIYFTFGFNYTAAKIIQAIIGAIACLFVYLIAANIYGPVSGFCAALIISIYPSLVGYSSLLYSESLAAFLLALTILIFIIALKRSNTRLFIITGASLGLLILCYPKFILLPFVLILSFFYLIRYKKIFIKYFFGLIVGVFLVVAPWTLRNYCVFKKFIPVSTGVGTTLWYSTLSGDYTEWCFDKEPILSEFRKISTNPPSSYNTNEFLFSIETNEFLIQKAVDNIQRHPVLFIKLSVKRFFRQWLGSNGNSFYALSGKISGYLLNKNLVLLFVKLLLWLFQIYVVVFAFLGMLIDINSNIRNIFSPALLTIVYSAFVNSLFMTSPRYQIPVLGLVFIYTVLGSKAAFSKLLKPEIVK